MLPFFSRPGILIFQGCSRSPSHWRFWLKILNGKKKKHRKSFFHHLPSSSCTVAIVTLEICGHAGAISQINVLFQQEQKTIPELQQKEEPQLFLPVHTTSCNIRHRNLTKHWAVLQRFFEQCCPFNSTFVLASSIPPVCRAD